MYSYNNGLQPAGRRPRLYLAKGRDVVEFSGHTMPGWYVVVTDQYTKNGKWSQNAYQLELGSGVRPLYFLSPMHGIWGESFSSWGEVATNLALPVEVAQGIVSYEYSSTAQRLDKIEEYALAAEADGAEGIETVVISFGSPTNREISQGFWSEPKSSYTTDRQPVTVEPGKGVDGMPNWYNPTLLEPEGGEIISSTHRPGMHGGYWTVEVAVPV